MDQQYLLQYIRQPALLRDISYETIKEWIQEYPYSQNLHYLLVKKSKLEGHPEFERHLRQAATYMNSRTFLRHQLNETEAVENVETPEIAPPIAPGTDQQTGPTEVLLDRPPVADLPDEALPEVTFFPDEPAEETDIYEPDNLPITQNRFEEPDDFADADITDSVADQPDASIPPSEDMLPEDWPSNKNISLMDNSMAANPFAKTIPLQDFLETEELNLPETMDLEEPLPPQNPSPTEPLDFILRNQYQQDHRPTPEILEPEETFLNPFQQTDNGLVINKDISDGLELFENDGLEAEELEEDEGLDDELDELLNTPLIEVIRPPMHSREELPQDHAIDPEPEELVIPDLPEGISGFDFQEDFDFDENLDITEPDEEVYEEPEAADTPPIPTTPRMSKWIKKYHKSLKNNESEQFPKPKKKKKKKTALNDLPDKKKKGKDQKKQRKKDKKKKIKTFARKSIIANDEIVSETLAELLVKQGNIQKGIDMYDRLSLIFPEKKAFFAARIQKLKKL